MKTKLIGVRPFSPALLLLVGGLTLLIGLQTAQAQSAPPPIGQTLVREGDYAVRLAYAFRVASTDNEVEAESRLGEIGISPVNGWMADYPLTPDILAQLRASVIAAADGGRLIVGRNEALKYMNDVNRGLGLPAVSTETAGSAASVPSPAPVVIDNYYASAGPPVITYYAPPPAWTYMYAWVPYPFWCAGFHFSGYYILHDFDRVIIVRHRPMHISNHYWDPRRRGYRIHPPKPVQAGPIHAGQTPGQIHGGPARPLPRAYNHPPRAAEPLPRVANPSARAAAPLPRVATSPRVAAPLPRVAASSSRASGPHPRVTAAPHQERRDQPQRPAPNRIERASHDRHPAGQPLQYGRKL